MKTCPRCGGEASDTVGGPLPRTWRAYECNVCELEWDVGKQGIATYCGDTNDNWKEVPKGTMPVWDKESL